MDGESSLKILVPVKRVVDYNVKIRVKSDGSGVELAGVKMSMNPFDEIAVEEALRLREAGKATEVIAVSIGPQQATETIRNALAMGADRGILVKTDDPVEPLAVAKILKSIVDQEQPALVILGKQAIDDDSNQTGQMLAALLGSPAGHLRRQSREIADGESNDVTREVDAGAGDHRSSSCRPSSPPTCASTSRATHQAARHHEGQVQAHRRALTFASTSASTWRHDHLKTILKTSAPPTSNAARA